MSASRSEPGLAYQRASTLATEPCDSAYSPAPAAVSPGPHRLRRIVLPLLLFCASVLTTTANGARFMHNFLHGLPPVALDSDLWPWPWLTHHPALFTIGFSFSGALLVILLVHEFAHYIACRIHGIDATLPCVLPAPTLSGTLGAVIQIRSRIPSRNALMDVGLYGPLAGFVASIIAIVYGFALSRPIAPDAPATLVQFGIEPLSIHLIHAGLLHWFPALPAFNHLAMHPVLLAGWIGLFITSLNLVPGGQLDGGHILYAISPRTHLWVTRVLPILLIAAGIFWWIGWLLWGIVLLLPPMRHPRVSCDPPLSVGRVLLGVLGSAILVLSFTPTPFLGNSLLDFFR